MGKIEEEIFAALAAEDGETVAKLVKQKFDPAARNAAGESFIECACLHREYISADKLLKAGAPATIRPEIVKKLDAKMEPGSIVHVDDALYYGLGDVALALIHAGVALNVMGNEGNTPLHRAVKAGLEDVCRELIGRKVDLEVTNNKGATPPAAVAKGSVSRRSSSSRRAPTLTSRTATASRSSMRRRETEAPRAGPGRASQGAGVTGEGGEAGQGGETGRQRREAGRPIGNEAKKEAEEEVSDGRAWSNRGRG